MTSRIVGARPPDAAWTEQERELLAAARQDRMPAEIEARLREALDVPPAAAASPSQLEPAPRTSFGDAAKPQPLFASKLPLWGALSMLALGAAGYYTLTRATSQPSAATTPRELAKLADVPRVMPPTAATPGTSVTSTFVSSPASTSALSAGAGYVAGAEIANGDAVYSGRQATPDQLRIEAELLEGARKALAQGALPDARQWLTRYQTRFAHGALQPESEVLAIELKVRTGARPAAKAQADHFLREHPQHPLRDRVRELTTPAPANPRQVR